MLLKSRKPGPRAKHIKLPTILYGSAYIGMGYRQGWSVTYRFYRKDVEMIADIVHGDLDEHMAKKEEVRVQRKTKRLRKLHIELKISYHTRHLECALEHGRKEDSQSHQDCMLLSM